MDLKVKVYLRKAEQNRFKNTEGEERWTEKLGRTITKVKE